MKIAKKENGDLVLKLSKKEWQKIGRGQGWMEKLAVEGPLPYTVSVKIDETRRLVSQLRDEIRTVVPSAAATQRIFSIIGNISINLNSIMEGTTEQQRAEEKAEADQLRMEGPVDEFGY
tara:strand:+ start:4986 stop:5342 length:357 start_codon:yes stop_codon:yes gene_type:complete